MTIRKNMLLAGAVIGVAAATFVGVTAATAATGAPTILDWLPTAENSVAPQYDENDAGQTYGTLAEAPTVEQLPDLVLVVTDQGGEGYVSGAEFAPPQFKSPEEALAWQAAQRGQDRAVTAYAKDGVTVVGTFTFQVGK